MKNAVDHNLKVYPRTWWLVAFFWFATLTLYPAFLTAQFQNILKPVPVDIGFSGVQINPTSGYMILQRLNFTSANYEILLSKLDPAGSYLPPSARIGSTKREFPKYLQKTFTTTAAGGTVHDGYIIVGETNYGANYDLFLIRTDLSGAVVWSRRYGLSTSHEYGFCVQQAPDGGFVACGYSKGTAAGSVSNVYVLRTNSMGVPIWNYAYPFGYATGGYYLALHSSTSAPGGIYVTGYSQPSGSTNDLLLMNIDPGTGTLVWANNYFHTTSNTASEVGKCVKVVSSGTEIAVTGNYGTTSVYTIKTTLGGAPVWGNRYLLTGFALQSVSIEPGDATSSDLVIGGNINASADKRVFLQKISTAGAILDFKKYFWDSTFVSLNDMRTNPDLGHIGIGFRQSGTLYDTYVFRTNSARLTPSTCPPITVTPIKKAGVFFTQAGATLMQMSNFDFPVTKFNYEMGQNRCFTTLQTEYIAERDESIAQSSSTLIVYPNPSPVTQENLTIETNQLEEDAAFTVTLNDFSGRLLRSVDFLHNYDGKCTINVHDLSAGIYFVSVYHNNKMMGVAKYVRVN